METGDDFITNFLDVRFESRVVRFTTITYFVTTVINGSSPSSGISKSVVYIVVVHRVRINIDLSLYYLR